MWYPEEPVTYCPGCDIEIPTDCFWRGRGYIITGPGEQVRTSILYSLCPECGRKQSVGLNGPWLYRLVYRVVWRLRYPGTRPPGEEQPVMEPPRRRVSGS